MKKEDKKQGRQNRFLHNPNLSKKSFMSLKVWEWSTLGQCSATVTVLCCVSIHLIHQDSSPETSAQSPDN